MARSTVSGKRVLIILGAAILIVSTVLYIFIIRLKLGGTDAIRLQPAPASGAAPSR